MQSNTINPGDNAPEGKKRSDKGSAERPPKSARRGQIIKKGQGKYLIRVYLGRSKDSAGKSHRHYYSQLVEGKREDAENALIQYLEMRRTGRLTRNPSQEPLGDFLHEYYFEISTARRRSNEIDWQKIETHVLPELGHVR